MSDLYETDILEWSDHQAALLRRQASGEKLNEAPDWANIIEEIESVGRDQLRAVESFLVQALTHDLKAEAWPSSREVPGWRAEARRFRGDATARFTPAMRQRIDLGKLYRRALRGMPEAIDGVAALRFRRLARWGWTSFWASDVGVGGLRFAYPPYAFGLGEIDECCGE